MNGPSTSNDADAQRRARRAEQQRKRRQAQRASADPGVTAKLQAQAAQKREYMRYRRTSETFYEQQTARRAAETEEQRAERRRSDAEAARKRRAQETEEQRQRRLDADRNAKRAKRMMQVEKQLRDHEARMFIRDFRRNPFGYCHKRDLSAVSKAVSPTLDAEFPRAGRSKPSAVAIKETSPCIPIASAENGGEMPCLRHSCGQLADQLTCVPVGLTETMLPCTCGKELNGTSPPQHTDSEATTTTIKTEPEESAASDEEFMEMPLAIEMGIGEEPCNPAVAVKEEPPDIPAASTGNAGDVSISC
ncbi:uncharacterized protein LOC144145600 isoform X3 [Haemaphysalis longicornis]